VSSILDALRKLEAAEAPPVRQPIAVAERPRARSLTAAGIALAFVAGAGLTLFLRGGRTSAPPAPVASATPQPAAPVPPAAPTPAVPTPATPPEAAPAPLAAAPPPPPAAPPPIAESLPPAAPAPPLPQAAVDAEPPRARVAAATPPPSPVARPAEPPAVAREVEPPPPPAPAEAAPREPESTPPPLEVLPRLPANAPHVQVNFLLYSRTPERRTVMLSVDGGSMATLHEGERTGDIEVARILADRVHVRWGGGLFSVQARD
jgi:hypothetical protein